MRAFTVTWRSARLHREYVVRAESIIGARLYAAIQAAGGLEVWQTGTLWKCPGCGDRTLRTEEFLEGIRRAEEWLLGESRWRQLETGEPDGEAEKAARWIEQVSAALFGCERDRVYITDVETPCAYGGERYISRI